MKPLSLLLPGLVLGGAVLLLAPAERSYGFTRIGGSLGLAQRDVRVFDNFADPTANDNVATNSQYPGQTGAEMAVWKAIVEWGSGPHGNGTGDPTQPVLGDGGSNFDPAWMGKSVGVGTTNHNILSAIPSCSGGTLAYTETPIKDGWRIRVCDNWTWNDGPGSIGGSQFDLQGVACHEYGHALGLGHSTSGNATMYPSVANGSTAIRSIASDDIAGVQTIYGLKLATKPTVTSVSIAGTDVTVNGFNFDLAANEVWFTNAATTANNADARVIVTGVASDGTSLTVAIPAGAGDGDVLVRIPGTGHDKLSNPFPIDLP